MAQSPALLTRGYGLKCWLLFGAGTWLIGEHLSMLELDTGHAMLLGCGCGH